MDFWIDETGFAELHEYWLSTSHYTGILRGSNNHESNNYIVAISRSDKMPFLRVLWQFCRWEMVVFVVLLAHLILELLQESE